MKGIFLWAALLIVYTQMYAGDSIPGQRMLTKTHTRNVEAAFAKISSIDTRLGNQAEKYLRRLQKAEEKIFRKLNTPAAKEILAAGKTKYVQLLARLQSAGNSTAPLSEYIPGLDSLNTLFGFLGNQFPGASPALIEKIQQSTGALQQLQNRLSITGEISKLIQERKQIITSLAEKANITKYLKAYTKQAYYYQQQISEYKAILNNPEKIAATLIHLARDHTAFREFFNRNSRLAQLFALPGGTGNNNPAQTALPGLQTRAAVQQQIGQQLGMGGTTGIDPQQFLQQQVQQAQTQLGTLKDKINQLGGGKDELAMPAFKPNTQKSKTLWQRLEYGFNIQSQRPNGWLPVTSDIAVTMGYKLNDKSITGIGIGYKIGWGKSFRKISISSEGLSLRSFADIRLKGSIWLSGGLEYNYQQGFGRIKELENLDAWQKSGLIGLSKKYKVGKKTGNLQLLWDFLSYSQVPRTQALKFRIGYVL